MIPKKVILEKLAKDANAGTYNNQDVEIVGDVDGITLKVINGCVTVKGSIKGNAKILVWDTPAIDYKSGATKFTQTANATFIKGDTVVIGANGPVIDGVQMPDLSATNFIGSTGKITISGTISPQTKIRAPSQVTVNGQSMYVLPATKDVQYDRYRKSPATMFPMALHMLLSNTDKYENCSLLRELIVADVHLYGKDKNSTFSMWQNPLAMAAENGKAASLQILVDDDRIDVNEADVFGNTPIRLALKNGHLNCVEILIRGGASLEDDDKSWGRSIMEVAREGGCEKQFKELLESKFKELAATCITSATGSVGEPSSSQKQLSAFETSKKYADEFLKQAKEKEKTATTSVSAAAFASPNL